MAEFCLQVLEFGDIGERIATGIAKTDLATTFELNFMASDHDFLASGQGDKAAVCAGVDQIEAITPSFDPGVLPGGFAIINDQFAAQIAANGQDRGLVVEQKGFATMAYTESVDGYGATGAESRVRRVRRDTLIVRPVDLEKRQFFAIFRNTTQFRNGIGGNEAGFGQGLDEK